MMVYRNFQNLLYCKHIWAGPDLGGANRGTCPGSFGWGAPNYKISRVYILIVFINFIIKVLYKLQFLKAGQVNGFFNLLS
jgi:hypothetical protein